jgi:chlorophyll(ide) b reductase
MALLVTLIYAAALVSPTRSVAGVSRLAHRPVAVRPRSSALMAAPSDKPGVVITGGAAGVGWAYALEFSQRGYPVVICDIKDTATAVNAIRERAPNGAPVYGTQCDVSDAQSVVALGEFAKAKLQTVGWWVNNAGINGGRRPFTEVPMGAIEAVVKVNLLGVLLCTQVAIKLMHEQAGVEGHIFNTVGSGVKGGGTPGYVTYGATKRGLPQMTDSLVKELTEGVQGYASKPTKGVANCHTLSPGMVFTDLLLNDSTKELRKFPFGVLAAQPEEVAADLVPKILATSGQGAKVEFLTTDRVLQKFVGRFLLGQKSQYIDDEGNVIKLPGAQYADNGVRALY